MIRCLECEHLSRDTNASMTLCTLIESAKATGIEPSWYLHALFEQLSARLRADPADERIFMDRAEHHAT